MLVYTKKYLLQLPRLLKKFLVIFSDILIFTVLYLLIFGFNFSFEFFVLSFIIIFGLFYYYDFYKYISRYLGILGLLLVFRVFIIYTILIFSYNFFSNNSFSYKFLLIHSVIFFCFIAFSRIFINYFLGSFSFELTHKDVFKSRILIYGAGSAGIKLGEDLLQKNDIIIYGYVDDSPNLVGTFINGFHVYSSSDLKEFVIKHSITDLYLAIPAACHNRRSEIISLLSGCGVRVRTIPKYSDLVSGLVKVSDLRNLDINDLLDRNPISPKPELLDKNIRNKVVLVTGAGGSIGSELCRQILLSSPRKLLIIDSSEHSLYLIHEELKLLLLNLNSSVKPNNDNLNSESNEIVIPCLGSVIDINFLKKIFNLYRPNTVFHAAAYKHVPMVERNISVGINNNVFGTLNCAKISIDSGVSNFVLVSSDKAVRPTNLMGASKRISELILQALNDNIISDIKSYSSPTIFSMVRFGNVLGSSGSVVLLFNQQISSGGPITLTHPDVTRYFMSIPEAAQLVIQSCGMAIGGDVFVLDMGNPIRIYDLATKLIYLSGHLVKNENFPHGDIEIKIIGLRPGEKLYEELLIGNNPESTLHPKIMKAHENFLKWDHLNFELEKLSFAINEHDDNLIKDLVKKLVPEYN